MRRRLTSNPKALAAAIAALAAIGAGVGAYATDAWPRLENETLDARFDLRKPARASDVVVVAIDDKTFSELGLQWPFPRSLPPLRWGRAPCTRGRRDAPPP